MKQKDRRLSLSMNPEQVTWMHTLLKSLQRGGDVTVIARNELSTGVARIFQLAFERIGKLPPPKTLRTHCKRGLHELTPDNTYGHGRQCSPCARERRRRKWKQYREAMRLKRARAAREEVEAAE